MKFRTKILLSILGVVLGLLVVTFVIVNYWLRVQIQARFENDLRGNYTTVHEMTSERASYDVKSCQIIAESPGIKAVSELGDKNTALQHLRELNVNILSDLFILTNGKGTPIVSLVNGMPLTSPLPEFESIRRALNRKAQADVWNVEGNIYRGASSPIMIGGDVIGALTIGFRVKQGDVDTLKSMTNSDVILAVDSLVTLSTLDGEEKENFTAWLLKSRTNHVPLYAAEMKADIFSVQEPEDLYVAVFCRINQGDSGNDQRISYLLVKPVGKEVRSSLKPVMSTLSLFSVVVLLITGAIGFIISNGISKPIAALVKGTGEISRGNYDYRIAMQTQGEMQFLAQKFEEMSVSLKEKISRIGETEQQLQAILDSSAAIISVKDIQGRFLLVNRRFESVFNVKREHLIGKTDFDIFPKEIAELYAENDRRVLASGGPVEREEFVRQNDGVHTYISNRFPLFDSSGKAYAVCGFSTDITDRKRLEETLRQAQKMESIGTLAGGIAHDFNNILAIILGYIARMERGKLDKQKTAAGFEAMRKATQRGADLVRQILTFARKTDILLESVKINDVAEELLKMLTETFPKMITFTLDLDKHLPSIVGDAGQIQQALLNLCVNARDAMPNGGTLTIRTFSVDAAFMKKKFDEADNISYACISVADSGTGMDAATRARIFEPFFTTKERGRGTGLGLAVVFGVVKSHHGFIDVESEVGHGTTFNLHFPVPPGFEESITTMKEEEQTQSGSELILLVEDEEILRELVKSSLEEKGYRVIEAADGKEAVETYRAHKNEIAVVLCDMGLPKIGGWDAFQMMRQINPDVSVIFASGYLDPELKTQIIKDGAKDFVQKPYEPETITKRIREVIDRK
ncbi:MAG: response regulator, partial [Bacteroidota bacterium]|nr:response regulator [Bacteroidota bacterium]